MKKDIFCNQCQHHFLDPIAYVVETACPNCNSFEKLVAVNSGDALSIQLDYPKIILRGKAPLKRVGKKNKFIFDKAFKKYRDSGDRHIYKRTLQDRENDIYQEKVEDIETGEIIKDVIERLSEHQGHGSARFKKQADT